MRKVESAWVFFWAVGGLAFALVACETPCSRSPLESYLHQAFDSIEFYSIHATYPFDSVRQAALAQLTDSTTQADLHSMLKNAVIGIDRHSFLLRPHEQNQLEQGHPDFVPDPYPFVGKIIENNIAYVEIRGFSGIDSVSADNYVDSLQSLLHHLHNRFPKGWIIDLRDNTGGNPYAMLAGLGPLIGEGIKAYSVDYSGKRSDYFYMKRTHVADPYEHIELADSAYSFDDQRLISVLIGPETASAGEVLVLAFKDNDEVCTIGEPTYGVTTGLTPCYLSDSACIYITSSVDYDRHGNAYGGKIQPDIFTSDPIQLFRQASIHILANSCFFGDPNVGDF